MSAVDWPQPLIDRIAGNQWVLFLGSGVSASCENDAGDNPPHWPGLLTQLCGMISDGGLRGIGETLIARGELLPAADHIRYTLDLERNIDGYLQAIRTAVDGPLGNKYTPSPLFDVLLSLDPRVVFTTNYDKLFEIASRSGFATHTFDSTGLSHDLRRGEPVLVKLHGSTDAINEIVLTRTDYARVMQAGRQVFDALAALSLTSTILFVGYSLDDPDIQLVLRAVGRPGMSPEAHFMLAPEPASPSRIPVFRESFGVSVLPYPSGDHAEAVTALGELSALVQIERARRSPPSPP
jgi:hypothetical protein